VWGLEFRYPGVSNPADASEILASTNAASGYAAGAGVTYQVAGQNAGINIGGFTLPGFTGISIAATTAATTNAGFGIGFPATAYAQAGAQFQATGLSGLANSLQAQTVGQLQNTVLSGLGPSPVNLAAVLKNPSKALKTVENMAIGYATSYVNNQVGQLVNSGLASAKTSIANALGVSTGDLSIKGAVSALQNQYNLATGNYALPNDFGQQQLAASGELTGTVADNVQYPGAYMPDLAQFQDTQLAAIDQWSGTADVGTLGGSFTSDIGSSFDF
jgi:hypothetical protein